MSDSSVIAFLNKMTDLLVLNLIWLISCLPIVTIGAATTSLYYVSIISIRQGDGYVVKRYIASFKHNFKQATVLWIMMLGVWALMIWDLLFWYRMETGFGKVMFCLSAIVAFVLAIVSLYIFPVLSKLKGTILSTIKNSAAFGIGYFPYTLILILLTGGFVWANLVSVGMNAITLFIGFALLAYMKSFFIYKVMMNHIDERFDDFMKSTSE